LAAVFTAYFDAAGTPRNSVVAVAGFVSNFEKWKQFELTWNKILEREGVSCLHMTDFVSFQGEFKASKGQ